LLQRLIILVSKAGVLTLSSSPLPTTAFDSLVMPVDPFSEKKKVKAGNTDIKSNPLILRQLSK
jgi:hypothetical protein